MSFYKRGKWYWADFTVDGIRYRKSLETRNWQEAIKRQRELIEAAAKGQLATQKGPKRLFEAVEAYLKYKAVVRAARTVELEAERLSIVKKHFGDAKLTSITPQAVARYQAARHEAGIANRTINMDVGALRRVLKHFGQWRRFQDRVQNLPENQKSIGRILTPEEQTRLFQTAVSNPAWEHVYCAAMLAANTSLRPVEVKHLQRKHADVFKGRVSVERSKLQSSHRVIPLNRPAQDALIRMLQRGESLGFTDPEHYIWPACQWGRIDPNRPIKKWDTAWRSMRKAAGLPGLRFHDLRHTIITEMAEMGVPDHVMESITGHLSRRMLEHYCKIRLEPKRKVLEELDARREESLKQEPKEPPIQ